MSRISKIFILCIVISFHFFICNAQKNYGKLTYNGKNLKELLTGRDPDFGLGRRDGCTVKRKLFLELKDKDALWVEGYVKDGDAGNVLPGTRIVFTRKGGGSDTLYTDSVGYFTIAKAPLKKIEVKYIGYWPLTIKGSSKKLF